MAAVKLSSLILDDCIKNKPAGSKQFVPNVLDTPGIPSEIEAKIARSKTASLGLADLPIIVAV